MNKRIKNIFLSTLFIFLGFLQTSNYSYAQQCSSYLDNSFKTSKTKSNPTSNKVIQYSPETIKAVLIELHKNGIPVNSGSLKIDRTLKTKEIIGKVTGRDQTGAAFYELLVIQEKLKWADLLKASGLDDAKPKVKLYTEQEILKTLKLLYENGVLLDQTNIRSDFSKKTSDLIQQSLGQNHTGSLFFNRVTVRQKLNWKTMLTKAGLDPRKIYLIGYELTIEEAAKVLKELRDQKIPINPSALLKDFSDKTADIIFKVTGRRQTGSAFRLMVSRHGYNWKDVLIKAKIDPNKVFISTFEITKEEALLVIKSLYLNNINLNTESIKNDRTEKTTKLIARVLEREQMGSAFYAMAISNGWVWPELLAEAGLDPRKIIKSGFRLTFEEATNIIKTLHQNGIAINDNSIRSDISDSTANLIQTVTGRWQTGAAFYSMLRSMGYSFEDLYEAAGIDHSLIYKSSLLLGYEESVNVIKFLSENGVTVHAKFISTNLDSYTTRLIEKVLGRKMAAAVFFEMTQEQGYSWIKLLADAGLDLSKIVPMGYRLTLLESAEVIRALYDSGVEVNYKSIAKNLDEDVAEIIKSKTGWKQTGYAFLKMTLRQGFKWNDLLLAASLDPRKIVKTGFGLTFEEAVAIVKNLYANNVKLNVRSIKQNYDEEVVEYTYQIHGRRQTGSAFYQMTQKKGFSWIKILSEAGLDITKIQLSGNIPFLLVNEITRNSLKNIYSYRQDFTSKTTFEFDKDGQGTRVLVDDHTAEQDLLDKEFNQSYENFSDKLSPKEQRLLSILVDLIEQGESLSVILSKSLDAEGEHFSKADLLSLITKIKENPEFIELLTP